MRNIRLTNEWMTNKPVSKDGISIRLTNEWMTNKPVSKDGMSL